jgi:hypothetical protein
MPTPVRAVLVACVVGALAIFGLAYRANSDPSANNGCNQPSAIDVLYPQCNTLTFSQSQVGVDIAQGYTAELTVNGVAIPLDQIENRPAQNATDLKTAPDLFLFTPGPGKAVEKLKPGVNSVIVFYRKLSANESTTETFEWFFNAS